LKEFYFISALAKKSDVTTRTIRSYEDQKLIAQMREGTRLLFQPHDRTWLKLILCGKRLGFNFAKILEIVDLYDVASGEGGQLSLLVVKTADRRAHLQQQTQIIEATLSDLESVENRCVERQATLEGRG
jgi:DNA-binding transcriptional MerR regulator